jgi:hypothetical protein
MLEKVFSIFCFELFNEECGFLAAGFAGQCGEIYVLNLCYMKSVFSILYPTSTEIYTLWQ